MKILVKRGEPQKFYVQGKLYLDENTEPLCDTLEGVVKKVVVEKRTKQETVYIVGIPKGTYKVELVDSPRYSPILGFRVPHVIGVPDIEGVLLIDGRYVNETIGCIGVGIEKSPGVVIDDFILRSISDEINLAIEEGEEISLEIV